MSAIPSQSPRIAPRSTGSASRTIVTGEASNEFVFAVVGHVGSGTSEIADALGDLLRETEFAGSTFEVDVIKARQVIREWATEQGKDVPEPTEPPRLADVVVLQNLGDEMRA